MSFCTFENSHEFFVTGMECYGTTTQEIMAKTHSILSTVLYSRYKGLNSVCFDCQKTNIKKIPLANERL